MTKKPSAHPHRWFIYSSTALLVLLCLAIILAAMLLLRRGYVARQGIITGSSMEPILQGPRLRLTCETCKRKQEFAWDTCHNTRPFRCSKCDARDMSPELDLAAIDANDERMIPGASVLVAPLRMIRTGRANQVLHARALHTSGLMRNDIVVIQDSPGTQREIKRLVGLPGERIEIKEGDIWVDGQVHQKSLPEALAQSILVNAWRVSDTETSEHWKLGEADFHGTLEASESNDPNNSLHHLCFRTKSGELIDNRLDVNAHDSHQVVSARDIGIAMQVLNDDTIWQLRFTLRSLAGHPIVQVDREQSQLKIQVDEADWSVNLLPSDEVPLWIVVAIVDGDVVIGSDRNEWFRKPLAEEDEAVGDKGLPKCPIEIEALQGKCSLETLLVFRDIYYRGANDEAGQEWESADRIVVLGDNVSSSGDSRARWDNSLPVKAVKGVVLPPRNPIEVLLKQ
jgi:signal peptidase I